MILVVTSSLEAFSNNIYLYTSVSGANAIISTCNSLVRRLKTDLASADLGAVRARHFSAVVDLLERQLRLVFGVYSEQKAIRMQREAEMARLARLEAKATRGEGCKSMKRYR